VQQWIDRLMAGCRTKVGAGYDIEFRSIRHRVLGPNTIPARVYISTRDDALALINRHAEAERWQKLCALTEQRLPTLVSWCHRNPLWLLEAAPAWERALAVVQWFLAHPLPGIYQRQIDIPGVDTKFIEGNQALIAAVLDAALPMEHVRTEHVGADGFTARFGLRAKPHLVQIRSLDQRISFGGFRHVAAIVDELAIWEAPALSAVIITENDINGLILPDHPGVIVLFGMGHGIGVIEPCTWLKRQPLYYWGDIDTHGFAMLSRLRGIFPHVTSMLMDEATWLSHQTHWGQEAAPLAVRLSHLTGEEQRVFDALIDHRHGTRVRLEQEQIRFAEVMRYFQERLAL
jgi:hypothetical protein